MRIMNSFPSIDLKEIYGILTIFLHVHVYGNFAYATTNLEG
jgi:hypothetical protein